MLIPFVEQIHIGVCIPNRKLHTQPMKQLEKYLKAKGYTLYYFEDVYREETAVEMWPHVDVILTFFSEGIDFMKVRAYSKIHKPVEINKIDTQFLLLDRRAVMEVLDKVGVPTAERVLYNRKSKRNSPKSSLIEKLLIDGVPSAGAELSPQFMYTQRSEQLETEVDKIIREQLSLFEIKRNELFKESCVRYSENDTLFIDEKRMEKPYVEKPVYSEDHNIHIYYSSVCKGRENGICRLFRKIGSKSSNFDKNQMKISYRDDGSYIYEKYLEMKDYLDIKVYVLGKKVYAETRKSPVKDGIVIRTKLGKEERKEIELTPEEISAVQRVSKAFGQFICGMDILRGSDGEFILVDVNGWSFVKSNLKYYTQKNLKYLDKKIKKRILKERASAGDRTRREDVAIYKKIIKIIKKEKITEISIKDIEVKSIHSVYRHARRTPKLKKKFSFQSVYLLEYAGSTVHVAGRDTAKVKEIEEILEREKREREQFKTPQNISALNSLKEITEANSDVRVKFHLEGDLTKLTLKWGGSLPERSQKEIEYEAMDYESFISAVEGDGFPNYDVYSPTKPISSLRTERKIKILANPEDRTQKTAEIFKGVLSWAGRVEHPIKEKYFCTSREPDSLLDKLCPKLASAYTMLKEALLYRESSGKLIVESVDSVSERVSHSCSQEIESDTLYRNKLTIKNQNASNNPNNSNCFCAGLSACECRKLYFLSRWCFAFNEYPLLTQKNTKSVIPMLLDFIDYDILSSQYETEPSPIFEYFMNIEKVFTLFNTHANIMYKNRIDAFFNNNGKLDIIQYLYGRFNCQFDTLYITKKFTMLILLKYILNIKDTLYLNDKLKSRIEETMHTIGFLSSIVLINLTCKGTEYILIKYSHGIHINNKLCKGVLKQPQQILRTERKRVLALIKKSVFFNGYTT